MNVKIINRNGHAIAVVNSSDLIIKDTGSALDFILSTNYEYKCNRIAINKDAVIEDFFKLSTGLAGEIMQKFVNYDLIVAIYGDYSGYTSKPLKDFIYESNKGNHIYFVADTDTAIEKLSTAKA